MNEIVEGEDFYFIDNGLMVFTKEHHLKRGHCCKNKCRHCPWHFGKSKAEIIAEKKNEANNNS